MTPLVLVHVVYLKSGQFDSTVKGIVRVTYNSASEKSSL